MGDERVNKAFLCCYFGFVFCWGFCFVVVFLFFFCFVFFLGGGGFLHENKMGKVDWFLILDRYRTGREGGDTYIITTTSSFIVLFAVDYPSIVRQSPCE